MLALPLRMKMQSDINENCLNGSGIYVKVAYRDEIRKFKILDHEKPYDDILNLLSRQYDFDTYSHGNVRLSYVDDDNDEITVSSNREVVDALNSLQKSGCCIKLKIKELVEESGSDSGEHPILPTPMDTSQTNTVVKQEPIQQPPPPAAATPVTDPSADLQAEIDNVIVGVRGSRTIGEEPVVVPNIFTSFQGKSKRQFEIEEGLVVCRLCPPGRTMSSTVDLNVIKSHTKSDIHIMALTYHVLGEWPALPALTAYKKPMTTMAEDLMKSPWRALDNTAAQLLATKYSAQKPVGQRRKRTSFSPATTLSLEHFANSINWKRGESEKINEFAKKHGLTFYQVKVWMNNHRPRKNLSSANSHHSTSTTTATPTYTNTSAGYYNTANSTEIDKVIAALEEPLQMKSEPMSVPISLPASFGLSSTALSTALANPSLAALSLPGGLGGIAGNLPTTLNLPLNIPTTLGLFSSNFTGASSPVSAASPTSLNASTSPKSLSSPFLPRSGGCFTSPFTSTSIGIKSEPGCFTSPFTSTAGIGIKSEPGCFSSPFTTAANMAMKSESVVSTASSSETTPTSLNNMGENKSPERKDSYKTAHPLSLDNVSLDSAFRPPSFNHNLHGVFGGGAGSAAVGAGGPPRHATEGGSSTTTGS